ncbi:hypothetical protein I4U23_003278 [Adineta vaga]|nr:hypothetical protein I4U23_003278 [Adineta vaga]
MLNLHSHHQQQQQQQTESLMDTGEEVEGVVNENSEKERYTFDTEQYQQQGDLSTTNSDDYSGSNLPVPVDNDERAIYIARLLQNADLSYLIHLDRVQQIECFLSERFELIDEIEYLRSIYEKQDQILKHRLDEVENENDRLMNEHRSLSKQLILYRNLIDAPENPRSTTESKDYQQLKRIIEEIVQENEHLYSELNYFKTSDPVYEQVQLLESVNIHLQQQLNQAISENNQMKQMINFDEISYLKTKLTAALEECEELRLTNKRLSQQQVTFSKQVHIYPTPPSSLSNQLQLSPISTHSSRTDVENLSIAYSSNDIVELHEHVHRLEQTLQQRDYDLQKLQNQIEKGTSSIMSSIEDLCIASSKVSSPRPASTLSLYKQQPTINDLQNEIDQLHDRLDELTNENQILQSRLQEVDTIYEENQYLYNERSQWAEEMEHCRLRQLTLVQEMNRLKQRENDFLQTNHSDTSHFKIEIDQITQRNHELEDELIHLREQMHHMKQAYERDKQDLVDTNHHYKQILQATQHAQKLPKKLARVERMNIAMANEFEQKQQEYKETIQDLTEQNEKQEQKYNSIRDAIDKLRNDYRQKELVFVQQMDDTIQQRDIILSQFTSLQNQYQQLQQENEVLKQQTTNSKSETTQDVELIIVPIDYQEQISQNRTPQVITNLTELQEKYDNEIAEYQSQIESLRTIQKQMTENYDSEILKSHQTNIQLQHHINQYANQLEHYRSKIDKLQTEINEKQNFIEQIQIDLAERSTLFVTINNQLSQENKMKAMKINELEQALSDEQQHKLQDSLALSTVDKQLSEQNLLPQEHHRYSFDQINQSTKRELLMLKNELITKSDENTILKHSIHDEQLRRHSLEMKLKRLKQEYSDVRNELYARTEENQSLQYELIECRLTADYYSHIHPQLPASEKSSENSHSSSVLQLYLKEKSDNLHCQLTCRTYQQQIEHLKKSYEILKQKYKQRLQEEKDIHECSKTKYVDYIRNIQRDLQETRHLLTKDADIRLNQQTFYQKAIDGRRQLLVSMDEKDTKEHEMHHENFVLTSKIHSLEQQIKYLNNRIDHTVTEPGELRRDASVVRFDINVSPKTSVSSSPVVPSRSTIITYIDSTGRIAPITNTGSVGFDDDHVYEVSSTS